MDVYISIISYNQYQWKLYQIENLGNNLNL
jgi:hypothetical protein